MKSILLALSFVATLSLSLTIPCQSAADAAVAPSTKTVPGTVVVSKDKNGKVALVVFKTDSGNLLVPTKSMAGFVPYDGKNVNVSCVVQGNVAVPLCVIGINQPHKISCGVIR